MDKKALKTNEKFRKILKDKKIGWRYFADYGLLSFNGAKILMGKWNNQYDFQICDISEIQ